MILVLMEYKWNFFPKMVKATSLGLNPCFNGIQMEQASNLSIASVILS